MVNPKSQYGSSINSTSTGYPILPVTVLRRMWKSSVRSIALASGNGCGRTGCRGEELDALGVPVAEMGLEAA